MHPETQQILVRDHVRTLAAEADAMRLATAARSNPIPPPRSPLATILGRLVRAHWLAGRVAG